MSNAPLSRTIDLPSYRLPQLADLIASLTKKAGKLGVPAPSFAVVREYAVQCGTDESPYEVAYAEVVVTYTIAAVVGNWRFLASIETRDYVDGQPRNRVSGPHLAPEIARSYVTAKQVCEHCHHARHRKQTYIVADAAGVTKQVGSTCLQDFLGVDPAGAIDGLQFDADIASIGEGEEWGCQRERAPRFYRLDVIAVAAVSLVSRHGFITKVDAQIRNTTTTGADIRALLTPATHPTVQKWQADNAPTAEHQAHAAKIVERLTARILPDYKANPTALDGFAFKLGIILNRGGGDVKDFQLFAAAINREGKEINREALQATATALREEWLPGVEIGSKVEVEARIESAKTIPTAYGQSVLVKFVTVDGFPITTFYSGKVATFVPGTRVKVRGTVKRLDSGKYGTSTVLTRVSVEPVKEAATA